MSPVIKRPQHKGKPPILTRLAHYLAAEEGREACLLADAEGARVEPQDLVETFGGEQAEHWHSIVSPTPEDCRLAIERHGGDREAAALSLGKEMTRRLERDTGRRVMFAAHFEERAGKPHFHFHFVGEGEARVRLYGRSGVIQRAWDRAWRPDQRPVVDWAEHKAFLATRQELKAVQAQMRELGQERYRELKAAPPDQKAAVREAFKVRELALIPQRYELEVKVIHHRYAAREDMGSTRHQAELVEALNRQTGAITRAERRGLPWEVLRGERTGAWGGGLARSTASTLTRGAEGALRKVEASLVAGSRSASMTPAPVVQPQEAAVAVAKTAALTAARIAARTATEAALKAASLNPPGLAVQAALLAVNAPGKVLDLVVRTKERLPDELALPLRVASATPGLGIPAKVAAVTTEATLKPLQKETDR
jgi:hypothetical protein